MTERERESAGSATGVPVQCAGTVVAHLPARTGHVHMTAEYRQAMYHTWWYEYPLALDPLRSIQRCVSGRGPSQTRIRNETQEEGVVMSVSRSQDRLELVAGHREGSCSVDTDADDGYAMVGIRGFV